MIADELSDKEIANRIGRTLNTVEKHVRDIGRALQLNPTRGLRVQIAVLVTRGDGA